MLMYRLQGHFELEKIEVTTPSWFIYTKAENYVNNKSDLSECSHKCLRILFIVIEISSAGILLLVLQHLW